MNLEYLEGSHPFHVERIIDFLSHSLPLCALHQSRTVIFFCYIFAGLLEFLLYPPYSIGNTPFELSTLFLPIIVVMILHILLTICYVFGALFERASCTTAFGLMFLLHFPLPVVLLITSIVLLNQSDATNTDFYFGFSVAFAVAIFLDFICGVVSRPSQRIPLFFELLGLEPSLILFSCYIKGAITKIWISFLPLFIFFAIYFIFLLFLTPCCKPFRGCTFSFLSDPELAVEFSAAVDPQLKPFKTRTDWADDTDALGSDHGARHETRRHWSSTQDNDNVTRFPTRAHFQLYNVDAVPETPLYLASPFPMFALCLLSVLCFIECLYPLTNFYYWFAGAMLLVAVAVLLNSRATACSFFAFTNLDDKCVDILWDHPSLSIL